MKYHFRTVYLVSALVCLLTAVSAQAGDAFKPFVLASQGSGTVADKIQVVKDAVTTAGFDVVGEYAPYEGAHIVIVSNDSLKQNAAQSDFGGYGAVQRISITQAKEQVQVAYTNPRYTASIYRMTGDLADVATALEGALGNMNEFGATNARSADDLKKYHYMAFMPYFDDHLTIGKYDSYEDAISKVEQGLANSKAVNQLYRVDIPGKEESVFGVSILEGAGADKSVMEKIDTDLLKHTAHLPYEILVSGGKAYTQHGKFRIAMSSPDLGMGTFMKISDAPDAIELTLKAAIK